MDKGNLPPSSSESKFVARVANAIIRWIPVGGSGGFLIHFLLGQEWLQSALMFPVLLGTGAWAAYTENFIETFNLSAGARGKSDAKALSRRISQVDKDLRWRFSKAEDKYLRSQANACRYYRVEGVSKAQWNANTTLEEVYVPLFLSGRLAGFAEGFGRGRTDDPDAESTGSEEKDAPDIWHLLGQVKQRPDYRKIAIIARGGFGKTTLLRHITYRYSHEAHRVCRDKGVPKLIPVLLYLRDCRNLIAKPDAPDLPTLIAEHHVTRLSNRLTELDVDWAKKLLHGGKALVLLDGFDEVSASQCPAVSKWIDRAMRDYGNTATFVLTTRPAGYDRYSGQQPFTAVTIKEFNAKQRDRFLHQWYLCQVKCDRLADDTDSVKEEAAREAIDLIEQIKARGELQKLADNPLLLCMIATYHRVNPARSLPIARPRLYQRFCQMLLEDRPVSKKMAVALPAEQSQQVLQGVALQMVQQDCIALSRPDMTELVDRTLEDCDEVALGDGMTVIDFVKEIEEISELFVRKEASDEYEFAHRSFQEYLAAVEIKQRQQETVLLSLSDEWRDTVVLYSALATPANLTTLIEQLCDKAATGASPEENRQVLILAYDCWLENTRGVPEETRTRIQFLGYGELEKCMKAGEWKEADDYTYRLMIQLLGKRYGDIFFADEPLTFPCKDLLKIDGLWVEHSQGRFGFSVQQDIYVRCGGVLDGECDDKATAQFFYAVGWYKECSDIYSSKFVTYEELIFSSENAVRGHLPFMFVYTGLWDFWLSLLSHPDL